MKHHRLASLPFLLAAGCVPSFEQTECFSSNDCDSGEVCRANVCVTADAATDVGPDTGADAAPDAGADAAPDAGADAATDAGADAAPDSMPDLPDTTPPPIPDVGVVRCEGEASAPSDEDTLLDLVERAEFEIGGPPLWRQLVSLNIDGDPGDSVEHVVVRGGRVEVLGADGVRWWQSPVISATRVEAVVDLDGDGPLEVVVMAGRQVRIYGGTSGRLRWALPFQAFGPDAPALAGIHRVLVGDVNGDGLPDLYVADSGCGGPGTGDGIFHSFASGFDDPTTLGVLSTPRCPRSQVLADLEGDGLPELIHAEADGIHASDPVTGERRFCGEIEPGNNGVVSAIVGDLVDTPGDEVAILRRGRITILDLSLDAGDDCALVAAPQIDLGGDVRLRAAGSALVDVDGDGLQEIVTSAWFPDPGEWRTLAYGADGLAAFDLRGAMLLGTPDAEAGGAPELLVALEQGRAAAQFAPVQLYGLEPGGPAPLWGEAIPSAGTVAGWPTATATHLSGDAFPPISFPGAAVLLRDVEGPLGIADAIEAVAADGASATRPLPNGTPGGAHRFGDLISLGLGDGRLAVLDTSLEGAAVPRATTGTMQLIAARADRPLVVAYGSTGVVAGVDVADVAPRFRWRVPLGVDPRRPQSVLPRPARLPRAGGDLIVVRDHRDQSRVGWAGVDVATGEIDLTVGYDAAAYKTKAVVTAGEGEAALVLTYDVYTDGDNPLPALDCDVPEGDLEPPEPACANRDVLPQLVTAWRPDGSCAWRAVIRPNTVCGGPSGQTITISDGELYFTESNSIRRIDPTTGAVLATTDLGRFDPQLDGSSAPRGGGWVTAHGARLVRAGGNGPVDVFDRGSMDLIWRADNLDDIALQAWVLRAAVVVAEEVWISPARGKPIFRYALADGTVLGRLWLNDGAVLAEAPPDGASADVTSLQVSGELVIAAADDGFLYGLGADGELQGAIPHAGVLGRPLVGDLDDDGRDELLVPVGDGRTSVRDRAQLAAPGAVWDVPCPPDQALCDPATDIDETETRDELCAQWHAVGDATSYETRLLGPNGAVIQPWSVRDEETLTDYTGLNLVPGLTYSIEVRAWRVEDDVVDFSEAVAADDGIRVLSVAAPVIHRFEASNNPLAEGERTTVTVEASDDDRVAGWSLSVRDANDMVWGLHNAPLAHPAPTAQWTWDGTVRGQRLTGELTLIARVVDRGGREATQEREFRVCAGACE